MWTTHTGREDRWDGEARDRQPVSTDAWEQPADTVVIDSPEELVASVPALLGFVPGQQSLVAICGTCGDGRQGPVIRLDAAGLFGVEPGPGEGEELVDPGPAQFLADFCERERVDRVHLVLVHPGCADEEDATLRARDAAEAVVFWLGLAGTEVAGALGVGVFGPGEAWIDLVGGRIGRQRDPGSTELAARAAVDGRVCGADREEIDELYRVRDADACDIESIPAAQRVRHSEIERRELLRRHDELARRMATGAVVDAADLGDLATALRDVTLRDRLLNRLATSPLEQRDGRRELWWAIARRRPASERSVALTLLGAAHYFSGGGVHAWSALAEAVEADPRNGLAVLMLQALRMGLPPDRLREAARCVG